MYIYIYIDIHKHIYIYIFLYIYIHMFVQPRECCAAMLGVCFIHIWWILHVSWCCFKLSQEDSLSSNCLLTLSMIDDDENDDDDDDDANHSYQCWPWNQSQTYFRLWQVRLLQMKRLRDCAQRLWQGFAALQELPCRVGRQRGVEKIEGGQNHDHDIPVGVRTVFV